MTLSFSLQVIGRPVASEIPLPWGPRNWGQLSPAAATAARDTDRIASSIRRVRMEVSSREGNGVGLREEMVF